MDEPEVHQYRNDCARIGTEYLPVFPVAINRKLVARGALRR
jgi:hypothetical protein